jgi:pimeloyl-ACP methyl ester carboxylesterase
VPRRLLRTALILSLAALVAWLPAPRAGADTDLLRMGTLILRPCEIGRIGVGGAGTFRAYCSDFDVPEDWDAPQARHIHLRVAILKSGSARPRPDLVTFLDGGPGGAATEDFPAIAPAFASLRERHDILLLDQRGTGGSNPLLCPEQSAVDPLNHGDQGDIRALSRCLQSVRQHATPQLYTTTAATRDLEALRQSLGAPALDLIGVSYGTRLAQQYATRFPTAVRSVVLDSVVPNRLALGSEHARNLEQALRALFAVCTAEPACHETFGDSYARLYRLRDRLRARPQDVSLHDPGTFQPLQVQMSAEDLVSVVRFYAYSPVTAALLPLMLQQAERGDFAPLLSQKQLLTDTLDAELSSAVALSVACAEDADLLHADPDDEGTLMGNSEVIRLREACTIWPRGERPADFHQPWRAATPVIILAGQYDPVTPPAYGAEVLQGLSDARLLIAAGQGHGVMTAGCLPRLLAQFVDDPVPGRLDAACLGQLGDTPAFVDFNGAPP